MEHESLTAALRTRGLLQSLRTRAPSIEELCEQFPNEDVDVVVELDDDIMAERQRHLETVADNLPSVVLYSSMTMSDQLRFNALASDGAGWRSALRDGHGALRHQLRQSSGQIAVKIC